MPATPSTVTVLPTNRFTYRLPLPLAYIQVGSMSRVRGMSPTQHGQPCQG